MDLISNDFSRAALHNQNTLVVVLLDDVGVGERFNVDVNCFLVFFVVVSRHYFRSFNFGGLECGIRCALFLNCRDKFYVYFSGPTDVGN